MVGLKYQKGQILEEVPSFFEQNVRRTDKFVGQGKKVSFLDKFYPSQIKELAQKFAVEIKHGEGAEELSVDGTRNDIANCMRELSKLHDSVNKDIYEVDSPAMVQHIMEDKELLTNVGLRSNCLVAIHQDDAKLAPSSNKTSTGSHESDANYYSTELPFGVTCVVMKGDITKQTCGAIVNPANENLLHAHGLAQAIVRAGGSRLKIIFQCYWSCSVSSNEIVIPTILFAICSLIL